LDDDTPFWSVWCSEGVSYSYEFTDNGTLNAYYYGDDLKLATMKQYAGHGFLDGMIKLSDYQINANFSINILEANVSHPEEWGRIALVFCVHLPEYGLEKYLEFDVYHSPNCLSNPPIESGDFRYVKIAQQNPGDGWKSYNITNFNQKFIQEFGTEGYYKSYLQAVIYTIEFKNSNYTISGDNLVLYGSYIGGSPKKISYNILDFAPIITALFGICTVFTLIKLVFRLD